MKITATQFISNDKDVNTFVSVFKHYSNLTEKKVSKEGDLYALLSISGSKTLPAERVSKFVWDGLVDGYLYSNAKTTNESLKDSIKEGIRKVKDLMKNDQGLEESGVNINFVIIAQKKEGLYLGNFGENDIYVYKDNRFVNIYEILKEKRSDTAGIALMGEDLLLVSTFGLITEGMASFIGHKNRIDVLESIENFGQKILNSEGMICFENKEEDKENVKSIEVKADILKDIPKPRIKLPKEKKKPFQFSPKIDFLKVKILDFLKKIKTFFKERSLYIKNALLKAFGKQHWFKKISSKISASRPLDRRKTMKGMKIDGYKVRDIRFSRIKVVIFGVLILVLIALGISFTINARKASERHKLAQNSFTQIEKLLDSAQGDVVVDISSAQTAIYQTEKLFQEIPSDLNEEDSKKLSEIQKRKIDIEDTIYKRKPVSEQDGSISNFLDPRLSFGEGSNPSDVEIYQDKSGNEYLLVTDIGLKSVYKVSLYDKKVEKLPDNESLVKDPKYISKGNTGVFVFDGKNGVLKAAYDSKGGFSAFKILSGLGIDDIDEKDITEMTILTQSDNVYLLSREGKDLLKSSLSYESSYSLSFPYIRNDSFANSNDILADLSLYFLTSEDPYIIRYVWSYYEQKQVLSPLSAGGFDGNYGSLTKGYTTGSLDFPLYLFDASGKRVLKLEKPKEGGGDILHPGQVLLKSQVVYRGQKDTMWSDVKDIVVDSKESAMYILEGSAIWKVVL